MKKSNKEIPPGLIRLVKGVKPSKKFYILLGISSFLVITGFGMIYFYNVYLEPKSLNIAHSRNNQVPPTAQNTLSQVNPHPLEKPQDTVPKSEKKESLVTSKVEQSKEENLSVEKDREANKNIVKSDVKSIKSEIRESEIKQEKASETIESFRGADFLYRARDFEQRGLLSEAIAEYKNYMNFTGTGDSRILNKIAALYLLLGKLKEAEHYSELAIRDIKNNREILINYGVIKAKLGEIDKAEESFLKVLAVEPDNKTALFNIAILKEKKGEYAEALKYYERLYGLGDKTVLNYIERLKIKR